jgi:hypothetical protein
MLGGQRQNFGTRTRAQSAKDFCEEGQRKLNKRESRLVGNAMFKRAQRSVDVLYTSTQTVSRIQNV